MKEKLNLLLWAIFGWVGIIITILAYAAAFSAIGLINLF